MRKTVLLFSLLALFAMPALADEPVTTAITTEAVLDQAVDTVVLPLFLDDATQSTSALAGDCSADAADAFVLDGTAAWCPFGAPTCSQHDDCDAYCGDPRFGWCFKSSGCCGCSG